MAHIALPEGLPGISGGFAFRPETAKPMRELAHMLALPALCRTGFHFPGNFRFRSRSMKVIEH